MLNIFGFSQCSTHEGLPQTGEIKKNQLLLGKTIEIEGRRAVPELVEGLNPISQVQNPLYGLKKREAQVIFFCLKFG